ncbi:Cys-tRNA(Pro) deacylase [Olsenella profusa]|uniref:Cys-tRNA(Pro)/Cys-tRNA(Cys) deacylase n=1 Tax=Olsenella profusa TaxID=138595 RepID=A0ABS2F1P4_9ACTN|nr:Cys-tRNA(Pro) deacylase [Olsenella profusa]
MARREKLQKTNAMRELEAAGVPFSWEAYEVDETDTSSELGLHIAQMLGEDPAASFKTLVCEAASGGHVVCCIPVADELDLKKAAAAAGEKSLAMMHVRDLEPVTGYVRGGCSPVGMKKRFPTLIDETAQLFDAIHVSGGRRGLSLVLAPDDLARFCDAVYADIVR